MASNKFTACVNGLKVSLKSCRIDFKKNICGGRLGDPKYMDTCHSLIKESRFRWGGNDSNIHLQERYEKAIREISNSSSGSVLKDIPKEPIKRKPIMSGDSKGNIYKSSRFKPKLNPDSDLLTFMKYHKCLKQSRTKIQRCERLFKKQCEATPTRAIKTVRATMESAKYLLEKLPNLRVIHLLRDPRAVVVSRSEFDGSGSGYYAGKPLNMAKEAMMFCRQMVRDIQLRHQLQQMYPGQIMEIIYDDFVLQPQQYTELVYRFANVTVPRSLKAWVERQTNSHKNKKQNSTYIATKWQEKMSYRVSKDVTSECEDFFKYVNYEWPE